MTFQENVKPIDRNSPDDSSGKDLPRSLPRSKSSVFSDNKVLGKFEEFVNDNQRERSPDDPSPSHSVDEYLEHVRRAISLGMKISMEDLQLLQQGIEQEIEQAMQGLRARENTLQELVDNLQRQISDRSSDEKIRRQIRTEEQRQAWTQWQERRRESLQEKMQSLQETLRRRQSPREVQMRKEQQQRVQRLQDIIRENQGTQQIPQPMMEILQGLLQDERRLQQEWQAEDRRLQGKLTAVHEDLEGLPHEWLREQLRQRVDDVLGRQLTRERLRNQLLELRSTVLNDYRELEPQQNRLSAEFQDALEERWRYHGHPEQDLRIILGYLTGRGPER